MRLITQHAHTVNERNAFPHGKVSYRVQFPGPELLTFITDVLEFLEIARNLLRVNLIHVNGDQNVMPVTDSQTERHCIDNATINQCVITVFDGTEQ